MVATSGNWSPSSQAQLLNLQAWPPSRADSDSSPSTAIATAPTITPLDGTDNNDPFFNNSALNQTGIGGAPASLLPIDAIQEFNLQSQFPAEYGRNSGSVVNIITKSGTNQLHGIGV